MSDPEAPKPESPDEETTVPAADGAAQETASDETLASAETSADAAAVPVDGAPAEQSAAEAAHDAELAAFAEAEAAFPGTFSPAPPAVGVAESLAEVESHADAGPAFGEPRYSGADEAEVAPPVAPEASADPLADSAPAAATVAYAPPAPVDEPALSAPEPTFAPATPQPIFVQAPEPPRQRGNRGTAGAIGLLAALVFGIFYLATVLGLGALEGEVTLDNIGTAALDVVRTLAFWVTVASFYLSFWLLGALINRGRWGLWVVFGLLVGAASYGGHLLGQLVQAPFWTLTAVEGSALLEGQLLAPLAIAAFLFGREITVWFGAWAARSGARKTVLNDEAQREYERTLEAGPQLPA